VTFITYATGTPQAGHVVNLLRQ